MKLLQSLRSRSKLKNKSSLYCSEPDAEVQRSNQYANRYMTPPPVDCISKLPDPVLERIFQFVCPHTTDDTYDSCELSALPDICALCDLRDLAHCVAVSRRWRKTATNVLYHSIRIDAVHYCRREEMLAEKRKRKARFDKNGEPEDTPAQRLRLLSQTLRQNERGLGSKVELLKLPYMTRETCKSDLARTVAVLPNLRYVDLPEGFYTDDPTCLTLKQEVLVRCPELRKMSFHAGSERSFDHLSGAQTWRKLEVLEVSDLRIDPTVVRRVLGALPNLRALKVTSIRSLGDEVFQDDFANHTFPPLVELIFENTPNITAAGLLTYISSPLASTTLATLSLQNTGVQPQDLQKLLAAAPALTNLTIEETITNPFPTSASIPHLSSKSLQTLHYEITAETSNGGYNSLTTGYYNYLATSLLTNGLPNLRSLYVREPEFPERVIGLAPPIPAFAADVDGPSKRFSSNNPFANMVPRGLDQELEIYSKGADELEWNFSQLMPSLRGDRRGSVSIRPTSSYGLDSGHMSTNWSRGHNARRSVIVGNGHGGFLALPTDGEPQRPSSSWSARRGSQIDMWR